MIKLLIVVVLLCVVIILYPYKSYASSIEVDATEEIISSSKRDPYTFKFSQIAIPLSLIAVASTTLYIDKVGDFDSKMHTTLRGQTPFKYDDYFQYMPMLTMWTLDAFGVKSQHRFAEQTTTLALAVAFNAAMVNAAKYTICRQRPKNGSYNSFPSGHTATAFMGAEFLRMEYRDTSPWIGVVGYGFALTTGYLRIYNSRHYLFDVIAGAGVGMLSVKMAYWLSPVANRALWGSDVRSGKRERRSRKMVSPYTTGSEYGLSLFASF